MDQIFTVSQTKDPRPEQVSAEIVVENFGKISKASVHIAPLTILIGRNNTGKSYIATLIWSMLSTVNTLFGNSNGPSLTAPTWFSEYVNGSKGKKRPTALEIKGEKISDDLNSYFAEHKDDFVRNLFSYNNASIGKIAVDIKGSIWLQPAKNAPREFRNIPEFKISAERSWQLSWANKFTGDTELRYATFVSDDRSNDSAFIDELYSIIVQKLFHIYERGPGSVATYVPAARTGLMLSLPSLYTSLIENFGINDSKADRGRFSLPTIRFLQNISRDQAASEFKPHSHIADFFRKSCSQRLCAT